LELSKSEIKNLQPEKPENVKVSRINQYSKVNYRRAVSGKLRTKVAEFIPDKQKFAEFLKTDK